MLHAVRTFIYASILLTIAGASAVHAQAAISYVYDELGRLVSVTDASGETATYTYDAVGNLLSIARVSSTTLSIIEFTPNGGSVGATVTVFGTGFSAVATENTVRFNGTVATVTAAATTQLTATVPTGATTGAISVTTSSGTVTSTASFTVTAAAVPAITSFTPTVGNAGTAVTVSGSNFDTTLPSNRLQFNATRATISSNTSTTIATTVLSATTGRIKIATPAGEAISSDYFFIPPSPYTAADVQYTGQMAFGENEAVAITTSGKIGLVVFDGTSLQRTSLKVVPGPVSAVTLYRPDGAVLATRSFSLTGLLEPPLLPSTASYGIAVDPTGTMTGTTTLTLYNVPADVTGTITPGGSSATVTVGTPGQNGRLTFSGTTNQRISLKVSAGPSGSVTIENPDGTTLASTSIAAVQSFIDTRTLSTSGTFGIVVNLLEANTGSVTLTLYDVPADITGTITPGGSPVTTALTTPGQNGQLTFSGTANQRVSLKIGGGPIASVTMRNPDNSTLASATSNVIPTFIDTKTLGSTGSYVIAIDPTGAEAGNLTFTLYDVPADVNGTITLGGASVPVTITTAGQNGSLTFSGVAGQQATVRLTSNTVSSLTVRLLKPDGSELTSSTSGSSSFNLSTQTLPVDGTYTISLDPGQWNTGSFTVQVTNP